MRALILALALLALTPALAAAEDTPPIITSASVTPNSFPYTGGTATITVHATDDIGIFMAYAEIYNPDSSTQSVPLRYAGDDRYEGELLITANFSDQQLSYGVTVRMTDDNGGVAEAYAGEASVDAQPQFDEAPVVSDPTVSPRALPEAGGAVTIAAAASDNRGLASVNATITAPDGTTQDVELLGIDGSRFGATVTLPANTTSATKTYTISIVAYDDIGQTATADAGAVTVAPQATKPPCPKPPRHHPKPPKPHHPAHPPHPRHC